MSNTQESAFEIVLTGESPRSLLIYSIPKKASLTIRCQKSGAAVLTLRLDGSKLLITSLSTVTWESLPVCSGESHVLRTDTNPSTSAGSDQTVPSR